ncbi:MAG TPA: secretin N-terminal domain-containing protein [Blastocatellia bacterium]|nr:secretin N-terminal domain-containing protein [Blastocatellia bacterium]
MKFRPLALWISLLLLAGTALAQTANEQKPDEPKPAPRQNRLLVKLYEVKYRDPVVLSNALMALRGGGGSEIVPNPTLKTISVKDYPENVAAIEEALKRLDVPEPPPVSLEFQLHLLSASMNPSEKTPIPKNLDPVVTQLQSTLKFSNYRYIGATLNRVSDGGKLDFSGVTGSFFPTPAGVTNTPENPSFYNCLLSSIRLTPDASGKDIVQISNFKFSVSVPIKVGSASNLQYREIGINTPLSLREGETAVVGTANISTSDEAVIVVVSIRKLK